MRFIRKRHVPGTAPGTLPAPVPSAEPARARVVSYDVEHLTDAVLLEAAGLSTATRDRTIWLDVVGHDVDLVADLGARLEVHSLALEDVLHVGQRPKIEDYEDSLFVVVDLFRIEDGELAKEQVSLILQENMVISVREHSSSVFEPVHQRLQAGRGRIRAGGAGYLAYALIDTVVDHLFPVLENLGDRLEELEASILDDPTPEDLNSLHEVKRDLLVLRKSAWPMRDMLRNRLLAESPLFNAETLVFLRDAADHAAVAVDMLEAFREMVASLSDLYLTNVSIRANDIMKVLTIIATIFIPLSFIAGLYGMNFDPQVSPWNMPELRWYWGYPMALGLMAVLACGLIAFIWRRKWL